MQNSNYLKRAKALQSDLIALRRDFHMHPEIGFEVQRTADIVAKELEKYKIAVKRNVGKTGVVGDLTVPGAIKRVALRADMDALPIQELNETPYKSRNPMRGHLCGHDAHTAMLLGAARILSEIRNDLRVNVRFVFQPSEEVWPGGAPEMIKDNVLEGVDEIYGLHVWPTLPVGKYGICPGPAMAQPDGFEIEIKGKGGHAAAPHEAIDPIIVATHLIQALQTIVSRNVNPKDSAVLTITQVHAGSSYNAIPESCLLTGTVRTYDQTVQKLMRRRLEEMVKGICGSYGAVGKVKYYDGYPVTFNHEDSSQKIKTIASSLVGESQVDFPAQQVMFGEDFAYYTQKVKGCFIHLGCRNEAKGITQMLHDPRFEIDEDCLFYGTAMHVAIASSI